MDKLTAQCDGCKRWRRHGFGGEGTHAGESDADPVTTLKMTCLVMTAVGGMEGMGGGTCPPMAYGSVNRGCKIYVSNEFLQDVVLFVWSGDL